MYLKVVIGRTEVMPQQDTIEHADFFGAKVPTYKYEAKTLALSNLNFLKPVLVTNLDITTIRFIKPNEYT